MVAIVAAEVHRAFPQPARRADAAAMASDRVSRRACRRRSPAAARRPADPRADDADADRAADRRSSAPTGRASRRWPGCSTGWSTPSTGRVLVDGLDVARAGRRRTPARRLLLHRPGRPAGDADLRRGRRAVAAPHRSRTPASGGAGPSRCSTGTGSGRRRTCSVHSLSGGQRQLLALAGVLATDPAVLVADEPTTLLDLANTRRVGRPALRAAAAAGAGHPRPRPGAAVRPGAGRRAAPGCASTDRPRRRSPTTLSTVPT